MGTRFELVLPEISDQSGEEIFQLIKSEVRRIHLKLNYFSSDSVVFEINKYAYEAPVYLDEEIVRILQQCQTYNSLTRGFFDVCLRPLYTYLKKNPNTFPIPDEVNQLTGMKNVEVDTELGAVRFKVKGTTIDLGGFGKGYALKKVKSILKANDITDALVSFGGSSILGLGQHPSGDNWLMGIKNIFDQQQTVEEISIKDQALSFSGNSFFLKDGEENLHTHIVNPVTKSVSEGLKTVGVVSESPLESEVLSTAFFVADDLGKENILSNFPDIQVTEIEYQNRKPYSIINNGKSRKYI